jgi:acyl carrier protein
MTDDSKIARLRDIVGDILGQDPANLGEDSGVDVTEGWDSLKNLIILMEVEQEFDHRFPTDDLAEIKTIRAIAAHLP